MHSLRHPVASGTEASGDGPCSPNRHRQHNGIMGVEVGSSVGVWQLPCLIGVMVLRHVCMERLPHLLFLEKLQHGVDCSVVAAQPMSSWCSAVCWMEMVLFVGLSKPRSSRDWGEWARVWWASLQFK